MADETPTAEDHASIERAGEELARRGWQRKFSVNQVVDGWGSLVRTVEVGYDMTIDDYTNDLGVRRWAAEARPLLTPLVRESMDQRLEPLDDRFRAATFESLAKLPGAGSDYWWETRLPLRLVGEMAEDVERMRLRPPAD